MGKCLVKKLSGTVSNDSILKVGEFVVDFKDKTTVTFNEVHDGRVLNGYFTDDEGNNLGTTKANSESFTCSAGSKLILTNKYSIINITCKNDRKCTIDTEYLKYKKPNGGFYDCNGLLKGDAANLKNAAINIFQCENCPDLVGKLSDIDLNTSILYLRLLGASITCNLSEFAKFTNLTSEVSLPKYASGDLSVFDSNFSKLNTIWAGNAVSQIYGDLSKLSPTILHVNVEKRPNKFTWKGTRPSSAKICIFSGGADFGDDIDAMLINQANCQNGDTSAAFIIKGNRTSASDAAVATLQSKGYTIWINDAQP